VNDPGRVWYTPPGVRLGPLDLIEDSRARNFVLQMKTGRFHGFIVRDGLIVSGFVDRCPHAGLPLAQALDQYLTPDGRFIACSWHGALFDRRTGACLAGPCSGQRLTSWPVVLVDGVIQTA
jgi:nitrite reductase/ring-hydroxylating ferredoxin subunit